MSRITIPWQVGDVLRVTWDDGSSRLFTDTGSDLHAPSISGKFTHPATLTYRDISHPGIVSVEIVAELGETLGSAQLLPTEGVS